MRLLFLSSALLVVTVLGAMTLYVVARSGIDVIAIGAFVILALLGLGLYGALTNPPPD